jgi:hypothetical protein
MRCAQECVKYIDFGASWNKLKSMVCLVCVDFSRYYVAPYKKIMPHNESNSQATATALEKGLSTVRGAVCI